MLRPSYTELMDIVNQDAATDNKITSRYSIVIAAAKRARQIIDGAPFDSCGVNTDKAVTIAINEMQYGKIKIFPEGLEARDSGIKYGQLKPRPAGRPGQGVGISADAVISSKDFVGGDIIDYGDDMDDDELFEDEGGGEKPFNLHERGYKERDSFGGEGDGYDDYDYSEDSLELDMDEENYDYADEQ